MPPWAVAEIAAYLVIDHIEKGTGISVEHNVRVPTPGHPDDQRQVDVLVRYRHSQVEFLHIVEVEDKSAAFGAEGIDELIGKAQALRASAASIVSTAGFTSSVLARVKSGNAPVQLRAITFGPPSEQELGPDVQAALSQVQSINDSTGTSLGTFDLRGFAFRDAVNDRVLGFAFVGHRVEGESEAVVGLTIRPPEDGWVDLRLRAITKPGSPRQVTRIGWQSDSGGMSIQQLDGGGVRAELRLPRKPDEPKGRP
jgi:hypothetical protein